MVSQSTDRFNGYVASLAFKVPCVTVATTNITLSGPQTIAGILVGTGDRVLVTGQTDPIENGIWLVTSSAWNRAPDFDGRRDATTHSLVTVARDGVQSAVIYQVDTAVPFIIGEDAVDFSIFLDPDGGLGAPPTHTGEVTGDTNLSLDVTAITNQTDVVADSEDDAVVHDDSDGLLKKVNLKSITDAGYF